MASSTSTATLSTSAWTSLGTGPLYIQPQVGGGNALIAVGSEPEDVPAPGLLLMPNTPPFYLDTTGDVWGLALGTPVIVNYVNP